MRQNCILQKNRNSNAFPKIELQCKKSSLGTPTFSIRRLEAEVIHDRSREEEQSEIAENDPVARAIPGSLSSPVNVAGHDYEKISSADRTNVLPPLRLPQAITAPSVTPRLYTPSQLFPTHVMVFEIQG